MPVNYVYPPNVLPVSLNQAKLHLRVDSTDEDTDITQKIASATEYVQSATQRQLVTATCIYTADVWPCDGVFRLPLSPVAAINSVKYLDTNGTLTTLSSSAYQTDLRSNPPRITPAFGYSWPALRGGDLNAVRVEYVCGEATPATVDATANTFTTTQRTYANGDAVQVTVSGGNTAALPTGISANTTYYVVSASGQAFSLSATAGGTAIDISTAGTGQVFIGTMNSQCIAAILLYVGHLYENREATSSGINVTDVPMAVKNLCWQARIFNGAK